MKISKLIAFLFIAVGVSGCDPTPVQDEDNASNIITATLVQRGNTLTLTQAVTVTVNKGVGIFAHDNEYTLLPGEYQLHATHLGDKYYRHLDKGIRMKSMGITEHRLGGLKIPINGNKKWLTWTSANTEVFVGGVFIFTGATDKTIVERAYIPNLSQVGLIR